MNKMDECSFTLTICRYFEKIAYRPVVFYRNGNRCECQVCLKHTLYWHMFEEYAVEYNFDVYENVLVDTLDLNLMVEITKHRVKCLLRGSLYAEQYFEQHLGVYNDVDLELLPENLRKSVQHFRETKRKCLDSIAAPFIFRAHHGCVVGI